MKLRYLPSPLNGPIFTGLLSSAASSHETPIVILECYTKLHPQGSLIFDKKKASQFRWWPCTLMGGIALKAGRVIYPQRHDKHKAKHKHK